MPSAWSMGFAPILQIREAGFGYAGRIVTRVPKLAIRAGEVLGLVGRSGAGKSTILAAINGALDPLEGDLLLDGLPRDRRWRQRHTSRTIQSFPLLHWLTVRQNLELAARVRGVPRFQPEGLLSSLGIGHLAKRYPNALSGGERARASVGLALVASPPLLLLDEPLTGLDLVAKFEVADFLFDLARRGTAIVFVTHDVYDVAKFSDRIAVLTGAEPSVLSDVLEAREPGVLDRVATLLGGVPFPARHEATMQGVHA